MLVMVVVVVAGMDHGLGCTRDLMCCGNHFPAVEEGRWQGGGGGRGGVQAFATLRNLEDYIIVSKVHGRGDSPLYEGVHGLLRAAC